MSLIGLGDIVPNDLVSFTAYSFFFLVSDVLSNQIFYFCQARIRFLFHFVARKVLLLKDEDDDFGVETTISLENVPVINTQCMPSR
uniref:Ion_trans_2 domain-containing protein n=1 Tax=Caenorhabditis tropicalis TaxID=1561998 RepID=A0A1I7U359_9PELO